jgi:hypothetical protein
MTLKAVLGLYPKDEMGGLKNAQQLESEIGYQKIQGTRPQVSGHVPIIGFIRSA